MKRFFAVAVVLSALFIISCGTNGGNRQHLTNSQVTTPSSSSVASSALKSTNTPGIPDPFPNDQALPEIQAVAPLELGIGGGEVTITGKKFVPRKTVSVTIGGVEAELVSVSPDLIVVIAPPAPALGLVSVTVTTAKGSVTLENAITYKGPEVVQTQPVSDGMQAVGVLPVPEGLVVAWKKCSGGTATYRFDLMDLTDPANPQLITSFSDLQSAVGAGLFDPSVLVWAKDNPGIIFPHARPCRTGGCDNAIFAEAQSTGQTIHGNVEIHGGVTILAKENANLGGGSSIFNNYDGDEITLLSPPNSIFMDLPLGTDDTVLVPLVPKTGMDYSDLLGTLYPVNSTTVGSTIFLTGSFPDFSAIPTIYQVPDFNRPPWSNMDFQHLCSVGGETYDYPWLARYDNLGLASTSAGELSVVDLSNSESPVTLGEVSWGDNTYFTNRYFGHDLERSRALITTFASGGVDRKVSSVDITDPSQPQVGPVIYTDPRHWGFPNLVYNGRWTWITQNSTLSGVPFEDWSSRLDMLDWSDPQQPELLGSIEIKGLSYDLALIGDFIYAAQGAAGLVVVYTH